MCMFKLTSLIIYLQVCRGEVDIHIVLKHLLKESLSLSQPHLLGRLCVRDSLCMFCLRYQQKQGQ